MSGDVQASRVALTMQLFVETTEQEQTEFRALLHCRERFTYSCAVYIVLRFIQTNKGSVPESKTLHYCPRLQAEFVNVFFNLARVQQNLTL